MSVKIPPEMLDTDAGRVLAVVICAQCGNRVIGLVQEHWPASPGDLPGAMLYRSYAGKVPGRTGTAIGSSAVRPEDDAQMALCPRHGVQFVNLAEVSPDAPTRAVLRTTAHW